jgi:tRNA (guanine37-N1)-methyltransferase
MIIKIITLFPEVFQEIFSASLLGKAQKKGLVKIKTYNLRDWATDRHRTVDGKPFGGQTGMILKADLIDKALVDLKKSQSKVILLTPQGKKFNQNLAQKLSQERELILICGRYEGFDERVRKLVDLELSIGDYILGGGEIPAMVAVEAITRLIPGVVGKIESIKTDSFSGKNSKLLDYPQYTQPRQFNPKSKKLGPLEVPEVLLSGDHRKIKEWLKREAYLKTKKRKDLKGY